MGLSLIKTVQISMEKAMNLFTLGRGHYIINHTTSVCHCGKRSGQNGNPVPDGCLYDCYVCTGKGKWSEHDQGIMMRTYSPIINPGRYGLETKRV